MSLVNDALKRAKQTQDQNPPPVPLLAFRPVEPANEGPPTSPLLVVGAVVGLLVVLVVGGLLVWLMMNRQPADLQAEARTVPEPAPVVTAPAEPVVTTTPDVTTNVLPVVVETPKPEFKLQGIFFNPRNPSAVINDRTVYAGDKVSGLRVARITPRAVTLTSENQTNVLSLSE